MNGERFLTDREVSEQLEIRRRTLLDTTIRERFVQNQTLKEYWKKPIIMRGNNFFTFMLRIYKNAVHLQRLPF